MSLGTPARYGRGQRGFSLTELMMVTVVIAVVSAIAIIQINKPRKQFSRQNISRDLKVALERARFDSVKRRAEDPAVRARVIITSNSFTLATDVDNDGDIDSSDNVITSFAGQSIVITGSNITLPATLTYNQRGEVIGSPGDILSPVFRICNVDCSSPNNSNSDLLVVTPTGTVNLLGGSSTVPTFNSPTVTTIGGSTDINPLVTVPAP